MKHEHFQNEMGRLAGFFGARPFTEIQCNAIWTQVSGIDGNVFSRVIDDITTSNVRLPPIGAITARCRPFMRELERRKREAEMAKLPPCRLCSAQGVFWALEKGTGPGSAGTAFRCTCAAGSARTIDERIVPWRESFAEHFEIVQPPRLVSGFSMGDF